MYWISKIIHFVRNNNDLKLFGISFSTFILFFIFKNSIIEIIDIIFLPLWQSIIISRNIEVLIFVIFVFLCVFLILKIISGFSENKPKLFLILTFGIIYVHFRYIDNTYNFFRFSFLDQFAYLDIIIIVSCLYFVLLIIYFAKPLFLTNRKDKKTENDYEASFDDSPWDITKQDLLHRRGAARKLSKRIAQQNWKNTFSIGIIGKWGDGKTSFLNMIEDELKSYNNITLINYNPWKSSDHKFIQKDFFSALKRALSPFSSEIYPSLDKYIRILFQKENSKISDVISNFIQEQNQIENEFDKVNKAIKRIDRKIIVFIDDLDRLNAKEIFEVIKLVRNTANFVNTMFITAFDKNYVTNALKEFTLNKSDYYLEKIFQQEITLPEYPHLILTNIIKTELTKRYEKNPAIKNEIETRLKFDNTAQINRGELIIETSFLSNIRDVKRFLNSFIHSYSPIQDEVDINDFFNLEILKLKAYPIYEAIRLKYIIRENPKSWNAYTFDEEKYISYFDKIEYKDKDEFKSIVKSLFPEDAKNYDKRSICFQLNFPIYFSDKIFNRLPRSEFNKIFEKSEQDLQHDIDIWFAQGYESDINEYISTIPYTSFKTKDELFRYFDFWFYLVEKKPDVNIDFLITQFEEKDKKKHAEKYFEGDITILDKFFISKLDESKHFRNSNIVYKLLLTYSSNSDYNFFLSKKQLQEYALGYLRYFLEMAEDLTRDGMWLYYHCVKEIDKESYIHLLEDASKMMKKFILEHPNFYIKDYIRPLYSNDEGRAKTGEPFTKDIFGSYEEFEKFLDSLNEVPELERVKRFFKQYKSYDYNGFYFNE